MLVKLPLNAGVNDLFTVAGSQPQTYARVFTRMRKELRELANRGRGTGRIGRVLVQ